MVLILCLLSDLFLLSEGEDQQRGKEKENPHCELGAKAKLAFATARKLHQVHLANHKYHSSQENF